MKSLILCFCILTHAWAGFPNLKITNLAGDYKDARGKAFADYAFYDLENVKISHKDIQVDFNKRNNNLVIKDPTTTVELFYNFDFLNVFNEFTFSTVNITSHGNEMQLMMGGLDIFLEDRTFNISQIKAFSDITLHNQNGREISILDGILLNGQLDIQTIDFGNSSALKVKKSLSEFSLEELISPSLSQKSLIKVIIRNTKLSINKGDFFTHSLMDSWINLWLRMNGKITHLEKESKLVIDLYRARLGIFSIRRFLLNKVRNLKLDTISVQGNRITIDMAKNR